MRREFIECRSRSTARKAAPWAAIVAKAEGGFWAFESVNEYHVWRGQK
tara:strand:- start:604 stop:747 length:144 start_codon:yes stop_codon:yes gene_type:complete